MVRQLGKIFLGMALVLVAAPALPTRLTTAAPGGPLQRATGAAERIAAAQADSFAQARPAPLGIVGRIEIPSVGLSAVIVEGSGRRALARGAGHVAETALPGESGNVVLAGHRDTVFRPLRRVHLSDIIRITTARGVYAYEISSTFVVDPSRIEVLDSTTTPVLTLVTCYPFNYVGHAPKRFVVRARQIETRASLLNG